MKQTTEEYFCDILDCGNKAYKKNVEISVIFTTEQTEGKWCIPYLETETLDLCKEHYNTVTSEGKMIYANGAQGCNHYYF